MREVRIFLVFLESCFADQGSRVAVGRFHGLHALGGGELINFARLADLNATRVPKCGGRAKLIRTEALPGANTASARASVTECDRDGVVRMTGLNPNGAFGFF